MSPDSPEPTRFVETHVLCGNCRTLVRNSRNPDDEKSWTVHRGGQFYGYIQPQNGNASRIQKRIIFPAPKPPNDVLRLKHRDVPPLILWGAWAPKQLIVEILDF